LRGVGADQQKFSWHASRLGGAVVQ